jgi:beta-lactamase regulating signal transducer with metallopeptidase domain
MSVAIPTWAHLQALVQVCTGAMLNCIGAGLLLALFAWIVVRFLGRQNSGTRFAVWFVSLLAIAVLPGLSLGNLGAVTNLTAGPRGPHWAITLPHSWALDLFLLWAAIAILGLSKVGVGLWRLRQLRRSCLAIELANLDPVVRKTWDNFANHRQVKLLVSERLAVPAAIGFIRPAVVIPAWSLRELSPAELNAVLLHELAHLQRWDDWTNLAQKFLRALFFFHPAVWLVESRLSLEREMACDDMVLAATSSPRAYAECLVSLAEKSFLHRGLALAQAAVSRMRQTRLRVSQILEGNRPRATALRKPAMVALAAFSVITALSLSQAPELVGFRDSEPKAISASAIQPAAVRPPAVRSRLQPVAAFYELPAKTAIPTRRPKRDWQSSAGEPASVRTAVAGTAGASEGFPAVPATLVNFKPRSSSQDQVSPAAWNASTQTDSAEEVFVVMQAYGAAGSADLTICVWRVTVWAPRSSVHGSSIEIPAKSI